jgi:hypothetical protein
MLDRNQFKGGSTPIARPPPPEPERPEPIMRQFIEDALPKQKLKYGGLVTHALGICLAFLFLITVRYTVFTSFESVFDVNSIYKVMGLIISHSVAVYFGVSLKT